MRYPLLVLVLLFAFQVTAQEELKFEEYSFSEFFQMIEDEPTEQFSLKNAVILYDSLTDSRHAIKFGPSGPVYDQQDSIFIDKAIHLENVLFNANYLFNGRKGAGLLNVHFEEEVEIKNSYVSISGARFDKRLSIDFDNGYEALLQAYFGRSFWFPFGFTKSIFSDEVFLSANSNSSPIPIQIGFANCHFESKTENTDLTFIMSDIFNFWIQECSFNQVRNCEVLASDFQKLDIEKNNFGTTKFTLRLQNNNAEGISIVENTLNERANILIPEGIENISIDWDQFTAGILNEESFQDYVNDLLSQGELNRSERNELQYSPDVIKTYLKTWRIENNQVYKAEIKLLGTLNSIYKRQHDTQSANAAYIALKDLETERLAYLYKITPSFDNFFEWKVNQFLKIFSAYGTRPAKAITFSVYVVFGFALIYLFFPNHWDSHGKDRILHRYQFFFKYLNKDAGMHDVYLDGKKDELAHYDGFKNFFIENGKTVPKFFLATALPLYRWSTASTRSSSWFLQKIDIFKGKWTDLPAPQRAAKTVLLTLAFAIALLYDIFIKMLNALMLSINTFTTLGFGEIPIKGLPRYLAIIQGFIGWFMLTIFSVSLISQLLN